VYPLINPAYFYAGMAKNNSNQPIFTLNCGGSLLAPLQPAVMGILNLTPDSFFEGSRVPEIEALLQKAGQMLADGATILDVGGQSTRPGSQQMGAAEELKRVVEPIRQLKLAFPQAFISVDTYHASVAEAAVNAGACMVNDISGGQFDPDMLQRVGQLGVPYICMHTKGTPETMQQLAVYGNLLCEIADYFTERLAACDKAGIKDVIPDPGFGFAKTIDHNFELLHHFDVLHILKKTLLAGISRKSFIYKTLGITAAEALNGTTALHAVALQKGAQLLRVHDVKEAVQAVALHTRLHVIYSEHALNAVDK
jgi:dihydropteroate synthase